MIMTEINYSADVHEKYGEFTGYCTTLTEYGYMANINNNKHLIIASTTQFIFTDPAGRFVIPCNIEIEINKADYTDNPVDYFINLAKELNNRIMELCISQMGNIKASFTLRPVNVGDLRDAIFSL